jgi:MYXO-CTERM domain-containing protein
MRALPFRSSVVAPLLVALVACSDSAPPQADVGATDLAFASAHGVLLDFEFDGELTSPSQAPTTLRAQIAAQLMYTVGQLNGQSSVGRMERLEVTNLVATPNAAGTYDVTYHAKLPVAWGRPTQVPASYTFRVPRDATTAGLDAWVSTYNTTCVGSEGSGADRWSFWYYYRPAVGACVQSPSDTVFAAATVTRSPENTVGKYPEYDKVWSDGALNVVAMFGRNESGATANTDAGIRDYNTFVSQVRSYVRSVQPDVTKITETPGLTSTPGVAMPQVTISATLPLLAGELTARTLKVDVMLTGYRIYQDGVTFDTWYSALTPTADMVLYNGHAGLGENVRTLMNKGEIGAGQYTIWMVNGCDTFAYVDPTLANRVSAANGGASPTLYLDTVSNAMPSYFTRTPGGSMTMIRALMDVLAPKTYPEIFANIDPLQIVVVTGEEDNTFDKTKSVIPGVPPGGLTDAGADGSSDAGTGTDGSSDAGTGTDGSSDAAVTDAGATTPDASSPPPAPTGTVPPAPTGTVPPAPTGTAVPAPGAGGEPGNETGCACETAPGTSAGDVSGASFAAFGLVGLFAARRRRTTSDRR